MQETCRCSEAMIRTWDNEDNKLADLVERANLNDLQDVCANQVQCRDTFTCCREALLVKKWKGYVLATNTLKRYEDLVYRHRIPTIYVENGRLKVLFKTHIKKSRKAERRPERRAERRRRAE
ncbi:uncharacterized protein LOC110896272 isoform X2 [Helianthus annuus]|uniref:uncharacterized protein LOC110896272 isoform X2 n=1 Tax=Helianthus annuus TaxID=4232 RepID=UPI000B8FA48E|nr:uncharacterized protein LOC110896272 isoform X2 [Helianthus annuus]